MNALRILHERGARFVLCRQNKSAIGKAWQKKTLDLRLVEKHLSTGGLIGVIPISLGCVVVDIDEGGVNGVETVKVVLGKPLTVVKSRRSDGYHLWYRTSEEKVSNKEWEHNGAKGDIRGSNGYAILWNYEQLADALLLHYENAYEVCLKKLLMRNRKENSGPDVVRTTLEGARNNELNRQVYIAAAQGETDFKAYRQAALDSGLSTGEVDRTIQSAIKAVSNVSKNRKSKAAQLDARRLAQVFAKEMKSQAAYSHGRGWFIRNHQNSIWRHDLGGLELRAKVHALCNQHARRNVTTRGVLTEAEPLLAVPVDIWDANDYLAGLPNDRVLDLQTGQIRSAKPDDRVTMRLGAVPDQGSPTMWLRVLQETFAKCVDSDAMIGYLRWWFRKALTGDCTSETLLFLHGPPGSGKSTIADSWLAVAGEYGATLSAEHVTGNSTHHRAWLARLANRRYVRLNEVPSNTRWKTSDLLSMSSGEILTANHMRKESFDFRSRMHICVTGNHAPIAAHGSGFWRRLRQIECYSVPRQPNPKLKTLLQNEAGQMLTWALTGPVKEPTIPREMSRAVATYRSDADPLSEFLNNCAHIDQSSKTSCAAIWLAYSKWCTSSKHLPLGERQFAMLLTERFGQSSTCRINGQVMKAKCGIRLKAAYV